MLTHFKIRDIEDNVRAIGEAWVDYYPAEPDVGQMFPMFYLSDITINNKRLEKRPNKVLEEIIIDAFEKELDQSWIDQRIWEYESERRYAR